MKKPTEVSVTDAEPTAATTQAIPGDSRQTRSGVSGSLRAITAMVLDGWRMLSAREKTETSIIFVASFIASAVELAALSTAVPFVGLLLEGKSDQQLPIIDEIFAFFGFAPEGDILFLMGGLVIVSLTLAFLFRMAIHIAVESFSAHLANRLVDDLVRGCLFGPWNWLRAQNGALLAQRITIDASSVGQALFAAILELGYGAFILAIGVTAVMVMSSWMTIGVLIGFGLVAALILALLNPLAARFAADQRHYNITSVQQAVESLNGAKVLKVSGSELFFLQRFTKSWQIANFARMKLNVVNKTIPGTILLVGQIAMLSLAMSLVALQLPAEVIVAQLTFILLVLVRVLPAVSQISGAINRLVKLEPSFVGFNELRGWIADWLGDSLPAATSGIRALEWNSLRFDHVSFRYSDARHAQLEKISFKLERNRSYAFVGTSGAGKSTLADIVLGLLSPSEGAVQLDDQALTGDLRRAWLSVIGYVPQEPFIIDDTLLANIAFGVPAEVRDEAQVWKVLELAELAEIVRTWPDGLMTSLGDAGSRLSGGQRQRVAIARALYGEPQVLVFDEATSALDVPTERAIRQTIARLTGNRTIITISHRMGSLTDCDRIYVLERGFIVASGNYEELSRDSRSFRLLSNAESEVA